MFPKVFGGILSADIKWVFGLLSDISQLTDSTMTKGVNDLKAFSDKCKWLLHKYSHAWVFLYGLIYLPWFAWLEKKVTYNYYVISSPLDKFIPFCEYFIVPYLFWFVYIAATVLYFFFKDKQSFYQLAKFLITGMTFFLVVCTVFPNGLHLRPVVFTHDDIFIELVKFIYRTDTPTNVLPSLHVYNSIGCYIAISKDERLCQKKWMKPATFITTVLIIMSTMFLKQHSVIDVCAAFLTAYVVYVFTYEPVRKKHPAFARQTVKQI